jgi:hypothetical protein
VAWFGLRTGLYVSLQQTLCELRPDNLFEKLSRNYFPLLLNLRINSNLTDLHIFQGIRTFKNIVKSVKET